MVPGPDGRAIFDLLRRGRQVKPTAFLCAFDLVLIADEESARNGARGAQGPACSPA
jgi:hypothetical protein